MQVKLFLKFKSIPFDYLTPSDVQENSYPHCGTGGGGRGVNGTSTPLGFLICCNFLKQFCPQWKALNLLLWYILWVVALLEVFDVTKDGRHLGHHLGFSQDLEMR